MYKCLNTNCNQYTINRLNNCKFTGNIKYCAYHKLEKQEQKQPNNLLNELTEMIIEIETDEETKLDLLKEDLYLICKDICKEHMKEGITK